MEQFNGFCDVYDRGKILSCMRLEYVDKTVDLLNKQHETIQVLKASNGEMEDYLARLEEENGQLKNEIEKIAYANEDLLKEKMQWGKLSDEYAKLYGENEELKEEHGRIIGLLDKKLQENDDNDEYARKVKIDLIMELKKELRE